MDIVQDHARRPGVPHSVALLSIAGFWLFNFAIGLFIPPAFQTIKWKLFIVFGVLCLGGAIQFWLTYPEVSSPHNFYVI